MNAFVNGLPPVVADEVRSQYAALCWRMHRGRPEVLLITSRDTGRWILPKGWPIDSLGGPGTAAREAWEEAGVTGTVAKDCVGFYGYDKAMKTELLPCMVPVFALRVAKLADKYPERRERRRKWFAAEKAARKVAEPQLRELLRAVAETPAMLTAGVADTKKVAAG